MTEEHSMNNKNPETDIGVQPDDQESKAASHWLFSLPQTKNGQDHVSTNTEDSIPQ